MKEGKKPDDLNIQLVRAEESHEDQFMREFKRIFLCFSEHFDLKKFSDQKVALEKRREELIIDVTLRRFRFSSFGVL